MADPRLIPDGIRDDRSARLLALMARWRALPIEAILVYRLDGAGADLLRQLAWQFNVLGDRAWALASTPAQRREVVRRAIEIHRHRGTRWAVARQLDALEIPAEIVEWWEDGGSGEPYTFRVGIDTSQRPLPREDYEAAVQAVAATKNVRSHLEAITVRTGAAGEVPVYGQAAEVGNHMEIWPWVPGEIALADAAGYAAHARLTAWLEVWPFVPAEIAAGSASRVGAAASLTQIIAIEEAA